MSNPLGIADAQAQLVDQLRAGGLRAVVDERDVNPPCVMVGAPVLTFRFGRPGWDGEFRLLAIVGDSGRAAAIAALDELLGAVQAALSHAVLTGTPVQWTGLDGSPALPAYELTLNTHARRSP